MRSTSNGNSAGSSYDRAKRRQWLLENFGNGKRAACALKCSPRCKKTVTMQTLTVDRIIPGCEGGTYRRDNIQPACGPCNFKHGGELGASRRRSNK